MLRHVAIAPVRFFASVSAGLLLSSCLLAQRVAEAAEPNNTVATATWLGCGQEAAGNLANAADVDWYRIVITARSDLRLQTGPSWSGEIGDTVFTLLDDAGAPLASNDDGSWTGYYADLKQSNLAAGTYYAAIHAGVHAAATGGYVLDVVCEASATPFAIAVANEGAENNDPLTGGIATSVILPVRCDGTLSATGHTGDWDFFRMLAIGDTMLRVRVAATASHAAPQADDLVLYLYDGATPPNLVAGPFYASDRSAWDQAIDVRIPGGIHHLAVRGVTGSQQGGYYLDLTTRASAAVTVFAGGCGGRVLNLATTAVGGGAPQQLESATLGATYSVVGSNLGSNGYAFHAIGLAGTYLDLTPFGAAGCALEVNFIDTVFQLADASGRAVWSLPVPGNAALLGTQLHSQAVVLDLSNPLGITTSNRVVATIGY